MCLLASELPPGPGDTLLGEVAGAPFYVDAEQDRRWGHPALLIDVLPGAATSLSLEGAGTCTSSPCQLPTRSGDAMTSADGGLELRSAFPRSEVRVATDSRVEDRI